jgi:hypothetical protein
MSPEKENIIFWSLFLSREKHYSYFHVRNVFSWYTYVCTEDNSMKIYDINSFLV